jgi:hypothetical protein
LPRLHEDKYICIFEYDKIGVVDFRIGKPTCIEPDEDPKTVSNVNEIEFDTDYHGGGHSDLKTTLIGLRKTISQFKLLMNQLRGTLCANETSITVKDATDDSSMEETIIFSSESESISCANLSSKVQDSVEDTMAISSESKDVSCENLRDSSNNCQTL